MPFFHSRAGGGGLHYHDLPGPGPPLLFLHGMGCASSCDYPEVAASAGLRGRRCILLDLLGSGYSERPAAFAYSMSAHTSTVVELVRALGMRRLAVYGHSMSGAVAIEVARRLSDRVTRLILSEPNLDPGGGKVSCAVANQSLSRYVRVGQSALARAARRQGLTVWAATLEHSYAVAIHREACSLVKGSRPSWRRMLLALPMKRTVLFGARSLPDPDFRRLANLGVRTVIVPRAAHGMAQDNPGGLARALAAALA